MAAFQTVCRSKYTFAWAEPAMSRARYFASTSGHFEELAEGTQRQTTLKTARCPLGAAGSKP
jgi:hypothetical protein